MARSGDKGLEGRGNPAGLRGVVWLRRHRKAVVALTAAGICVSFLLDLLIPGYAIAGFYLLPLMLVALALQRRAAIVLVGALCLALTVCVMVVQDRMTGQNMLLVWFGALAGAGLIALGYLYNRFDRLYERERATTARLHSLTTQLQRLQEVSVLDSQRPLSELLADVVAQARQMLDSDDGRLFRLDSDHDTFVLQESPNAPGDAGRFYPVDDGLLGRAVEARRPVAAPDLEALGSHRAPATVSDEPEARTAARAIPASGACLAVPLVVGDEVYGVIALLYGEPRTFSADDDWFASVFADQAALAIENARLREQVERSAVAAERSRLARELHDSVTQSLFGASLNAEALLRESENISPQVRARLEDMEVLTRGALAEMRTLLLEMRPTALGQASLADLLDHVVRAAAARTDTPFELAAADACPLPSDVTIALYRIAQEATANIVRHAAARRAWVTLASSADGVTLVVGDDGCGFDEANVGAEHFGLRSMRERAEAAGVTFVIDSAVGRGTVIRGEWCVGRG